MGRPPAYVFVVRHGKRLDAADKQWHLSSPSPYDPPLTYGGWAQSKTVGSRIASILREREAEDEALAETAAEVAANGNRSDAASMKPRKKRRYRVVIHSSPFLRCVQTSIAISAGIASNPSSTAAAVESFSPQPVASRSTQTSSFSNPAPTRIRPTISTPGTPAPTSLDSTQHIQKSVLRLDPFLGEWLSPDYFEHITPPPKSGLMLATAKAELLRRENYKDYPHFHHQHIPTPTISTQLWNGSPRASPLITSMTPDTAVPSGLETLPGLKSSLPKLNGSSDGNLDHDSNRRQSVGYTAPIPAYALSSSEPIPKGYVAHARDACIENDYQWDSSRDNLAWGDGGDLPEEWAAMHQRFRKGLRRLVEWYATTQNPGEMVTRTATTPSTVRFPEVHPQGGSAVEDTEDVEIEDVVILVSHGAGCNALIGAITQQPVLADVGMSSLSMARRRSKFDDDSKTTYNQENVSSLEEALTQNRITMPEIYELKLFASTEHLHSAVNSPSVSRSSSIAGVNHRGRFPTGYSSALKEINFGASLHGGSGAGSRSNSANASLGSMRRGSAGPTLVLRSPALDGVTVGSGVSNFTTRPHRSGSKGLWAPKQDEDAAEKEAEAPMLLDFSFENEAKRKEEEEEEEEASANKETEKSNKDAPEPALSPKTSDQKPVHESSHPEEHDSFDASAGPQLWAGTGTGNTGLWGAPRPPGKAERIRDFSSTKRRWTVNER